MRRLAWEPPPSSASPWRRRSSCSRSTSAAGATRWPRTTSATAPSPRAPTSGGRTPCCRSVRRSVSLGPGTTWPSARGCERSDWAGSTSASPPIPSSRSNVGRRALGSADRHRRRRSHSAISRDESRRRHRVRELADRGAGPGGIHPGRGCCVPDGDRARSEQRRGEGEPRACAPAGPGAPAHRGRRRTEPVAGWLRREGRGRGHPGSGY